MRVDASDPETGCTLPMSLNGRANQVPAAMSVQFGETIRVSVVESSRMASEMIEGALSKNRQRFKVHAFSTRSSDALRELDKVKPDVTVVSSNLEDGNLMGFKVLYQL